MTQGVQEAVVCVLIASGWMAPSNAKSEPHLDLTLCRASQLAFQCQLRQMHRTHRT